MGKWDNTSISQYEIYETCLMNIILSTVIFNKMHTVCKNYIESKIKQCI